MASDVLPAGGYYETTSYSCDRAAMQNMLDAATADRRAVITVVKCDPQSSSNNNANNMRIYADRNMVSDISGCIDCLGPVEKVIDRRVYVEETIQQYEPVIKYFPTDTYVRKYRIVD